MVLPFEPCRVGLAPHGVCFASFARPVVVVRYGLQQPFFLSAPTTAHLKVGVRYCSVGIVLAGADKDFIETLLACCDALRACAVDDGNSIQDHCTYTKSTTAFFLSWTSSCACRGFGTNHAAQVSIVAGMTAGVAGAIVSQPADTILTRINTVRQPAPVPAAPAPPTTGRRNLWDMRPSFATVGSASSSGGSAAGAFGRGGQGVGLMEKEAPSSEGFVGQEGGAAAPDWKEVVREMFEDGEGVAGLFRLVLLCR